jgi:branched-chain amino acid transport system permease protein
LRLHAREAVLLSLLLVVVIFPFFGDPFDVYTMIIFFMWAVIAVSWNLMLGFGGIPSFGNLVFFGVAGYVTGYLAIHGYPIWLAIAVGTTLSVGAGFVMGAPTLRLKGVYVALFTFACEEFVRNVVLEPEMIPWTGGGIGLQGVPRFPVDPSWLGLFHYYLALGILVAASGTIYLLLRSRAGLALMSVRESELYARSLGVNVYRYKLLAFLVGSFFTGLIGSFYVLYTSTVSSSILVFNTLLLILVMVLIGGLGTQFGPILGAFILTFVTEYMRATLLGDTSLFRLVAIGLLIPVVLIFLPSGLVGLRFRFPGRSGGASNGKKLLKEPVFD